jgi:glycerophosphoryl diester phosphodiesterase
MRVPLLLATPTAALVAAPAAQAQNPWLDERVLDIAHQGGEDEFPSNTLHAFKRSVHAAGYAWHMWLSNDGESRRTWRTLLDHCVDGVMTARPVAFERVLRNHRAPEACR